MKKTVVVTGASGGIGREIARVLSRDYAVLGQYRTHLQEVADIPGVTPIFGDFSTAEGVKKFADEVKKYGGLYGLVNCAGVAKSGLISDFSDSDMEKIAFVDLIAPMLLTKALVPELVSAKCGSIVNVSSIWGVHGGSCEVPYSAAKGGIIAFTKALARELGPSGVRVNCVAPGFIDTAMNAEYSEEDKKDFCKSLAIERIGTPADVAAAVAFLLSDGAGYITAQVLGIDGGF